MPNWVAVSLKEALLAARQPPSEPVCRNPTVISAYVQTFSSGAGAAAGWHADRIIASATITKAIVLIRNMIFSPYVWIDSNGLKTFKTREKLILFEEPHSRWKRCSSKCRLSVDALR